MPQVTVNVVLLLAAGMLLGVVIASIIRGKRARQEKAAVNAGWQEQIEAQRSEHDRLTRQNKGLMEQMTQYQASNKDAKNRAQELAEAVQEAYARRDELQRQIKDIRNTLETALTERDQLQSDVRAKSDHSAELEEKDAKIARLRSELKSWQERVPPLLERYRQRNEEAKQLEEDLALAREQIASLEVITDPGQTRVEAVRDPELLTNGRDASNDPVESNNNTAMMGDDTENSHRDRLQRIKGVGPAIEKTLNEMGIFRFHQIAEMSQVDIDRVADRLKGFHSRIYREDWIGQARELLDQTSTD